MERFKNAIAWVLTVVFIAALAYFVQGYYIGLWH